MHQERDDDQKGATYVQYVTYCGTKQATEEIAYNFADKET